MMRTMTVVTESYTSKIISPIFLNIKTTSITPKKDTITANTQLHITYMKMVKTILVISL